METLLGNLTGSVGSVTNPVTVGTNNDKTGYSLSSSQTFNITGNLTGSVGSVTNPVTIGTNNDKTGYSLSSSNLTTVINSIWNEPQSSHLTSGTFGYFLDGRLSTFISDNATPIANSVWDAPRISHSSSGSFGEGITISPTSITNIINSIKTTEYDSITQEDIYEMLVAFIAGKATVSRNNGIRTISFYKRDGIDVKFIIEASEDDGSREFGGAII